MVVSCWLAGMDTLTKGEVQHVTDRSHKQLSRPPHGRSGGGVSIPARKSTAVAWPLLWAASALQRPATALLDAGAISFPPETRAFADARLRQNLFRRNRGCWFPGAVRSARLGGR